MDRFHKQVHFHEYDHRDEFAYGFHIAELDCEIGRCSGDESTVVVVTDGSVHPERNLQAVFAAHIYRKGIQVRGYIQPSGRVLAPEAEMSAQRIGICKALSLEGVEKVVVVTDSIAPAKRLMNPPSRGGLAHSLAVSKLLSEWLESHPNRSIHFWPVISKSNWPLHKRVHDDAITLHASLDARYVFTSYDYMRKRATDAVCDAWIARFAEPNYAGRNWLGLTGGNGRPIKPKYAKGGPFLPKVNMSNSLCARFTRAVTNHAPIGEYRERFFPLEPNKCRCDGVTLETRQHVLWECSEYDRTSLRNEGRLCMSLDSLITFLQDNPRAFAFEDQPVLGIREGGSEGGDVEGLPVRPPMPSMPTEERVSPAPESIMLLFHLMLFHHIVASSDIVLSDPP